MTQDFKAAQDALETLCVRFAPGTPATVPSGARHVALGVALHSETLERLIVLLRTDGTLLATRPEITSPSDAGAADADIEDRVAEALAPKPMRHKKGGLYTRLADLRAPDGACVLYKSHADGTLWVRPRDLFETPGRFTPAPDVAPARLFEV